MKATITFNAEIEMDIELNENMFDIEKEEDSYERFFYLKDSEEKEFHKYLKKLEKQIETKINEARRVEIERILDEDDNEIYEY
jgi:hypothetical protein